MCDIVGFMDSLPLHEFHGRQDAQFTVLQGRELVSRYARPEAEHAALRQTAGLLDLSYRARICLTGKDRQGYLNGQASNNIKSLRPGQGCYTAILNVQGRMDADCHAYCMNEEMLLDVEPGFDKALTERLEKFIVSDDVELTNVSAPFGHLSVQGPLASRVFESLQLQIALPQETFTFIRLNPVSETYVVNHPRTGSHGFDLFVHVSEIEAWATRLLDSVAAVGGCACGWEALETARVEAGIPRFGADMDSTTLPTEAGIVEQAVSYQKGCYVGQEIMARLRSRGSVPTKELRGLWLPPGLDCEKLPGTRLLLGDQDAGWITSAVASPHFKSTLALGYVRAFAIAEGTHLETGTERIPAKVIKPPF